MQDQSHTLIGVTKTAASLLYTALAIIGLTIGYFIPQFAKWALSLPWIPFEGPLRLVTSFQGSPAAFITALLGMCAGIWFAHSVIAMLLSVKITDDTVELIKGKKVGNDSFRRHRSCVYRSQTACPPRNSRILIGTRRN